MQKIKSGIRTFFLSLLIYSLALGPSFAVDTASLLPPGVLQLFDNNGNPLTSGYIYTYEVGTSTLKTTWKDSAEALPNTNPIRLDAGGKAIVYGSGTYRTVVKDRNGNLIWDAVTAPGGGGGSTPTLVGDGNLVGTVLPWSGLIAPNQYVFAYGQEIARATHPDFYTATTQQLNVICSAASNTLTGISDTQSIRIGEPIELALCVPAGTTVVSKTAATIILSNPSNVSINATATFFPWGNGNGSTTFNVPDYRGVVLAGRDNMGGTAAGVISQNVISFGTNTPDALGATGGATQGSKTLLQTNLPNITLSVTGNLQVGGQSALAVPTTASPQTVTTPGGLASFGSSSFAAITFAGGVTSSLNTGVTQTQFSVVQPTITINYIVKITPDTSTSIATGVYSIGGMQGVIACGTGILCTGNIISATGTSPGGISSTVQFNNNGVFGGSSNFEFISPDNLTLGAAGITGKFDIFGSTSGKVIQVAQAVAGTPTITWGTASGTPAATASSPLAINFTTGNITCSTCATTSSGGTIFGVSPINVNSNAISISGQALTRTNDTNVTLTLDTGAATALISPSNLTLGWTGQLALTRGGTNNSLTASNGGIVWSDASKLNILSGTATANLPLLSSASATPSWSSISYPTSATSGGIPYFSSTSVMSSSALLAANSIVIGGGAGVAPSTATPSQVLDLIGSTRGSILERGAASWGILTPGTSGLPFVSAGAGADPGYSLLTATGGGTNNAFFQVSGPASSIKTYTFPNANVTIPQTIASGTAALGTGAISSATCATVVSVSATGTATTDVVNASFNGDPTGVTGYVPLTSGMLTIVPYPTANNVNFKVCNNTAGSITPGAITLNWQVIR